MTILSRRRIGGGILLASGLFFGREAVIWLFGKTLDFASKGASGMTLATFPWQNTLAVFLTLAGGFIAFWPGKKTVRPTREDSFRNLASEASSIVARIRRLRNTSALFREMSMIDEIVDVANDGMSLLVTFGKNGITIPDFGTSDAAKICIGLHAYYNALLSCMRDGHVDLTLAKAERASNDAVSEASVFVARDFFLDAL